ncbi:hypothetical protein G6F55_013363 [Rhizopus delemar]|nr:hypothetical protein G6F55_013363 [Rhizopus delemar]KAG1492942.1 hypothetical protein G6F52_013298 [Rhizopus delemar]
MEDGNVNAMPSGTEASSWAVVAANGKPRNKVRRRLAAARGFQPVSGDQGFEYVDNWHFRPRWINHDIYGSIGAITTFQIWKYIFLVIAHRLVPFSFSNSDYLL